ncbi:hypothetical protein [Parvularcula dongshanensis]|uniref:XapX domain-containing protein n=1 Tax=Parvularcula dongshanensis TaxID=1173995 RepID=A0A840I2Y2_9PROT|nr:hypothetical protein [Parvularcula dongshanensis]MBB4658641.1 hypothetical protein [Parvularcula dongshanensis]
MSLPKIILLSVLLGLVIGAIDSNLFGPGGKPALVGSSVAFVSVVAAGALQPKPRRRRRPSYVEEERRPE